MSPHVPIKTRANFEGKDLLREKMMGMSQALQSITKMTETLIDFYEKIIFSVLPFSLKITFFGYDLSI